MEEALHFLGKYAYDTINLSYGEVYELYIFVAAAQLLRRMGKWRQKRVWMHGAS